MPFHRRSFGFLMLAGATAFLASCRTVNPAAEAFARGEKLQAAGLLADAQIVYTEAIHRDPQFAPAYRSLAEIATRVGDTSAALSNWEEYLKRAPSAKHGWCHLAEAEIKATMEVPALEHAERELKRDPDCPLANLIAGLLYAKKSNPGQALSHLEAAARAFPNQPKVQLTYGRVLAKAQQYDTAETVLTPLVNKEKSHPEPFYWLGYVHARRANDAQSATKAESLLHRALALNPHYTAAAFELGRLFVVQHRATDAIPLLKQAVQEDRNDPASAYSLAQAYTALGKSTEAAEALATFKKRSDIATKRKELLRQLAVAPRDAELNHAFGLLERERGDLRSASQFLEAAHSLAPQSEAITRDLESLRQQHPEQLDSPVPSPSTASEIPTETTKP